MTTNPPVQDLAYFEDKLKQAITEEDKIKCQNRISMIKAYDVICRINKKSKGTI